MPFFFTPTIPFSFFPKNAWTPGRLFKTDKDDMDLEDVLAKKRENLEKLILNEDEAIRREMLKYEEAEFNIRLQSECFNLYPVVVKALSLLIADDKRRCIFCSILKGHKLEKLATYYHLTQEDYGISVLQCANYGVE